MINNMYIFIVLILFGCNSSDSKVFSFKNIEINIPNEWEVLRINSIDSDYYKFITDDFDTISFYFGIFSPELKEEVIIFNENEREEINEMGLVGNIFFSKDPILDYKLNTFHQQLETDTVIKNMKIFFTKPKYDKGIYGASFTFEKIKLVLFGKNISIDTKKALNEAIYSVKYFNNSSNVGNIPNDTFDKK